MEISVPEELKSFVERGVASGRFRSEDEAICEGLNLLRSRERQLEALRADLQVGIDQLDRGEKSELDIESIKARGRERRQSLKTDA